MGDTRMNKAEEVVYKYVVRYFGTRKAVVLQHYPVFDMSRNCRYEPDNLIVDQEFGIINIEVKGLTIANIERIEGHDWICRDFYIPTLAPFKQAERQIDSFYERANGEGILKSESTKRIFIALPFIESGEWSRKGLDPICTPTILFKDDFQNGDWVRKLDGGILHSASPCMTKDDFESMAEHLSPKVVDEDAVEKKIFSKLWVLNDGVDIPDVESDIMDDLRTGIKSFIIAEKDILEKIDLPKDDAYFKTGILNIYQCEKAYDEQVLIIDGKDIDEGLSTFLEGINSFNYRQYQAIHHPYDGSVAISASAGTGKTYLLVDRVMFLLATSPATLEDITIITFTNAATDEMRGRIIDRLESLFDLTYNILYLKMLENIDNLRISTIHSFAKNVILDYADNLGISRSIKVTGLRREKRRLVEALLDEFIKGSETYDVKDLLGLKYYELVDFIMDIMDEIEKKAVAYEDVASIGFICDGTVLGEVIKYVVPRMDARLNELKRQEDKLEINDLIRMLGDIDELQPNDDKMRFLFVDEFQDSDNGQIDFFTKLMNGRGYRLFVIGDIKQSIYRFRGADHTAYEQLKAAAESELPELSLVNNYRSSNGLIKQYNRLFLALAERGLLKYGKKDIVRGQGDKVAKVSSMNTIMVNDSDEAAEETVELVRSLRKSSPKHSIAILVRSNRNVSMVRDWFEGTGFVVKENVDGDFFTSEVVMDFRCLLVGLLFNEDPRSLFDAYTSPYFGFMFDSLDLMAFDGDAKGITSHLRDKTDDIIKEYVSLLSKEPLLTVVNRIIKNHGLYNNLYTHLKDNYEDEDDKILLGAVNDYARNLHHLFKLIISTFDTETNSLPRILGWLDMKIKTDRKEDSLRSGGTGHDIEIMTVHKSKGLEFDYVILPILDKSFSYRKRDVIMDPKTMSLSWKMDEERSSGNYGKMYWDEMEEVRKEETRLLYVAMTRAIRSMTLMIPQKPKKDTWAKLLEESLEVM